MEDILAFALEAWCTVGHNAFALRGSNLAAEIGLAGLAELAFAALGCAVARISMRYRLALSTLHSRLTTTQQPNRQA